jgi:non-heme chloroperoxidase
VFSHGWPLSSDDWDAQTQYFGEHGFRCIAHDRRVNPDLLAFFKE